jgi:hypothetical protein
MIERVTDPKEGPPDGVTAEVQCVLTQFDRKPPEEGQEQGERIISGQATMPCHIFCAYSEGTIGFSIREIDLMLTVRLDELFEIFKEASEAAQELKDSMPQEYTDAEFEKRWDELADIPFDEADSPSGLILSQKWWVFPKGTDRDDVWKHFDENHSKGIGYLLNERFVPPAEGGGGE